MKQRRHIRSLTAITLALSVFTLALWLLCMGCLTNAAAQIYFDALLKESNGFTDYVTQCSRFSSFYQENGVDTAFSDLPGSLDWCMLDALRFSNSHVLSSAGQENGAFSVLRDETPAMETAVLFYGPGGQILHKSGNYLYFQYATQDVWTAEQEEQTAGGYAWIDLDDYTGDDPYVLFRTMYAGTKSIYDVRALRITGRLEGAELRPVKLDYVTETLVWQALDQWESDTHTLHGDGSEEISRTYTLSALEHAGLLEWQPVFDRSDSADSGGETATFYALYPQISLYAPGPAVTDSDGTRCDSLLSLLETAGWQTFRETEDVACDALNQYDLGTVMVFGARHFRDLTHYDFTSGDPLPEPLFSMITVIRSHPLETAMFKLRNVYLVTFLLALAGVLALRKKLRRQLIAPLTAVNAGMGADWPFLSALAETPPGWGRPSMWREPYELGEHYRVTRDTLRTDQNELTRLSTALDYAKTAEQNRRQMTSNIAHELKTPLSVVHSYAEGLKEHIADDKRDKYLDVILSETERMDAMVLEMLDLSRLEAGKVRLSRDEFSLSALARSVFERLELPAQARELHIICDFPETCTVTADEARIGQVIENFASNAVKYTPAGGTIRAAIRTELGHTVFSVENDGAHLSDDALRKVWDTFYRADEARSGGGTGLGLAIARSIVALHGGTCGARNTKTGVEFSFRL